MKTNQQAIAKLAEALKSIPPRYPERDAAFRRIVESLRLKGATFGFNDVMAAIKTEGMVYPMRALNQMVKYGHIKFVGEHRNDQRYSL